MSKTAFAGVVPTRGIISLIITFIDDLLMKSARISIQNGDLPRFGI